MRPLGLLKCMMQTGQATVFRHPGSGCRLRSSVSWISRSALSRREQQQGVDAYKKHLPIIKRQSDRIDQLGDLLHRLAIAAQDQKELAASTQNQIIEMNQATQNQMIEMNKALVTTKEQLKEQAASTSGQIIEIHKALATTSEQLKQQAAITQDQILETNRAVAQTNEQLKETNKAVAQTNEQLTRLTNVQASGSGSIVEAIARLHAAMKLNVDPGRFSAIQVAKLEGLVDFLDNLLNIPNLAPLEYKGNKLARKLAAQLCKEGYPQRLLRSIGLRKLQKDWSKTASSQAGSASAMAGSTVAGCTALGDSLADGSNPADSSMASSGAEEPEIDVPRVHADIGSNNDQPFCKAVKLLCAVCSRLQSTKLEVSERQERAAELLCTTGAGIACALAAAMPGVYMPSPDVSVGASSSRGVSSSASQQSSSPAFPPICLEMDMGPRAVYHADTSTLEVHVYEVKQGAAVKQATAQLHRQLRLIEWAIQIAAPGLKLQFVGNLVFMSSAKTQTAGFEQSCKFWKDKAQKEYNMQLTWSLL